MKKTEKQISLRTFDTTEKQISLRTFDTKVLNLRSKKSSHRLRTFAHACSDTKVLNLHTCLYATHRMRKYAFNMRTSAKVQI